MSKIKETSETSFMEKVATFIVDKRNLFFLLFILASIFSVIATNWVKVENDVTTYLPESTETRQGLRIMNREFTTYATAKVMVANISYDRAKEIKKQLENVKGVSGVAFDNTTKHFKNSSALFTVTFKGEVDDSVSLKALQTVKEKLAKYDTYISSEVGDDSSASLANEMRIIIIIAAVIILLVLLFTSKSYAEIPVLVLTFGVAALLNKGTNFILGRISFISNSVSIVLQLALAIDYAIIFCHRYSEEHETKPAREATITALSKAIPEILSSSLTTISGLAALITMQFRIGGDLAFVLIKAIFFSLLTVFTLMPGLLMIFSKWIDKSVHKNFVPKITALGKFDVKTKYVIPPIFLVIMIVCCVFSMLCPYCYGFNNLSTPRKDEKQIVRDKINSTFRQTNLVALVVPAGHYDKEAALLNDLEKYDEVDTTLGLSNTEAMNGYMLTDKLTPREFSELIEVDYEVAEALYAAYAVYQKDYGKLINHFDSYRVPMIDMILFLQREVDKGYVTLDSDLKDKLRDVYTQVSDAKKQLQSEKYSRMLVYLNLPEEGTQTFQFLDTIHKEAAKYYGKDVYVVGDSTSDRDLSSSFSRDNIIISVLSALFVVIVLFFTFKSAGLPILLIIVIQGSIWINFAFPYLEHSKLYFLGYLIVNAIQMGANIDYAIVISSRYTALKPHMSVEDAMIETLNQSFPTIITSGAILASAGILIGQISTNGVISAIGVCLGRGTIISMILVMAVLPQILLIGDKIIERTAFSIKPPDLVQKSTGTVFVNGRIRGRVSGVVDANMHGIIRGDVSAMVDAGNIRSADEREISGILSECTTTNAAQDNKMREDKTAEKGEESTDETL